MSRYKFRVWDKNEKWMVYDVQNAYDGMWSERNSDEINDHYDYVSNFKSFMDEEEFNFMQYTGLKDKNGVEIYEGDIVHLTSDEGVNYNALIIFKDGGFCAINGTESDYSFRRYDLSRFDLYLEVIGNVYQNPELLEVES